MSSTPMRAHHLLLALLAIAAVTTSGGRLAAAEPESLLLQFQKATFLPSGGKEKDRKKFRDGLSGIAFAGAGKAMFLACDETVNAEPSLEQLTRRQDGSYGDHQILPMSQFMPLISNEKDKDGRIGEIDMEALAVSDEYLWFLGSHSANRKEAKEDKKAEKNLERLAEMDQGPNRLFIGRIPLVKDDKIGAKLVAEDGKRKAGRLTKDSPSWDIFSLLKNADKKKDDEHFASFFERVNDVALPVVPSKDNGFDIEGMAVVGERVFLGLRGPVLRGSACILEVRIKGNDDGSLKLDALADGNFYHKHFVDLGGLGVRDLHLDSDGDSLWILSGPTMALDGPTNLRLWKGAITAMGKGHSVTFGDKPDIENISDPAKRWEAFIDLGALADRDHPEGIALFPGPAGQPRKMVILYDGIDEKHTGGNATDAKADLLSLP